MNSDEAMNEDKDGNDNNDNNDNSNSNSNAGSVDNTIKHNNTSNIGSIENAKHKENISNTDNTVNLGNSDNTSPNMNITSTSIDTTATTTNTNCISPENIEKTAAILTNINSIKDNLAKLPLNPEEKAYIDVNIQPLLNILNDLSSVSYNLAGSSNILATSIVRHGIESKLRSTNKVVYDINEECEELYKVLKKRLNGIT